MHPGFSEGGANGNAWPHGCGSRKGDIEAFTTCANVCSWHLHLFIAARFFASLCIQGAMRYE